MEEARKERSGGALVGASVSGLGAWDGEGEKSPWAGKYWAGSPYLTKVLRIRAIARTPLQKRHNS